MGKKKETKKRILAGLERLTQQKVYLSPNCGLPEMAALINTNRTYLSEVVHEELGMSVPHYINQLRIEDAKRILREDEEVLIAQLSRDLGYATPNTFVRNFQRICGMKPSQYRKAHRGK